ncbi:HAD-IC family P-type ATPase [Streptococcus sobrinus]|uniref:HAD-IC family P-type ATPase n=2 Tax=Streptococcus sobrinus TaxID=1310 RepID=UPI0002EAF11C|nr:HAD-IC family P-type ATPase [Streptococcus sobrinus]
MSDSKEFRGLTSQEVASRIAKGQVNKATTSDVKTTKQIIKENTLTYFNLIFAVLTILLLISGNIGISNFTFLPVVFINAILGIVQELRSRKIVSKLAIVTTPNVTVLRDGRLTTIPIEDLVLDDVIQLSAGNQISVDATVLSDTVQVDESILTGEADEISKAQGDELMSGSFVVAGTCLAKVIRVGEDTYAAKLVKEAKAVDSSEQSEMIRSINAIVKWVGILIIPLALIMLYQSLFINQTGFGGAVKSMVAAVIGLIPEGLYLLTTISLVASTMRLARKQVVLHDMKSVEKLARVDVLCIDKTGTITENSMSVQDYIATAAFDKSPDTGLRLDSLIARVTNELAGDNDTMEALQAYFTKEQANGLILKKKSLQPFKSSNKYSGVIYDGFSYLIGAPQILLGDDWSTYEEEINHYAAQGYRVLAFGKLTSEQVEPLAAPITPYAFILISNPIRQEAPETFAYFGRQDVAIKVISGDDPVTVSHVAGKAQIKGAENYVDARTLVTDDMVKEASRTYTVFGRVTPELKRQLVLALQGDGHIVAMTGDGVNDVLALKAADCSIAMASGSDAALNASQIVLVDSNFASMPSVVAEGRRTVNNIERSASLFLIKNIFSFLLAILSIIFAITYPLKASQISLISAFMIGLPSYLLTLEANNKRISGHFMLKVLKNALPAAVAAVAAIGLLVGAAVFFQIDYNQTSTVSTFLLSIIGFMALVRLSRPLTKSKVAIIAVSILAFIISAALLKNIFELSHVTLDVFLLGLVFFLVGESIYRNLSTFFDFIANKGWRRFKWFRR